ncbi:MAG: fibronectin type III domain-containing protein, partial [Treponema sp.]|nr:fibronectin type III domain-containing protein [Treponema sp.]
MNVINKKRKNRFTSLGIGVSAIVVVTLLIILGCPGEPASWRPPDFHVPGADSPPATPFITSMQDGSAFVSDVDLAYAASVNNALTDYETKTVPVIAFTWTGGNADYYNIYFNEFPVRPPFPQITGVNDTVYFIREGLKPATEYFVWVEAVNEIGTTLSAPWKRTTRLLGGDGSGSEGTLERGDYPRNIKIEPGNGTLTVWWDIADRIGWSEVYISEVKDRGEAWSGGPMVRYGVNAVNIWESSQFPTGGPWTGRGYGANSFLWPFLVNPSQGWTGYYFSKVDGVHGDTRPMIGTDSFGKSRQTVDEGGVEGQLGRPLFQPAGAFPYVFEAWWENEDAKALGRLRPYKALETFPQFLANDVFPWDDENNTMGTPGIPVRHYKNHATITGLKNGKQYEVWIRVPNANGERGFGVVRGIPGSVDLAAPTNVTLSIPEGTTRELHVGWNPVDGAEGYRLYYSQYNETPGSRTAFQRVAVQGDNTERHTADIIGLLPGTQYFIWVAAEVNNVGGP